MENLLIQKGLNLSSKNGASTPEEVECMKRIPYASAVGSIMYTVRCTRPEVVFAQILLADISKIPEWISELL